MNSLWYSISFIKTLIFQAYGRSVCKGLAQFASDRALRNADNYCSNTQRPFGNRVGPGTVCWMLNVYLRLLRSGRICGVLGKILCMLLGVMHLIFFMFFFNALLSAVHCHHDIAANTPQNACHNGLIFNHIQWHAGCSGRRTAWISLFALTACI